MNEFAVGSVILGTYRIERVFTGGGMGVVYHARHLLWDIDVAIKHPRPEILKSKERRRAFEEECNTWSRIGLHPYLVTCFYTREIGGLPCVVAEFVEGGSLRDWIDTQQLFVGEDAVVHSRILRTVIAMALGLDRAHDEGLIHCDIKPGNVLITPDEIAKITDFGLAKASSGSGGSASPSWFTPAYASPEQVRGDAVTKATDFWSWAVSVMEIFTGGILWQSGPVAGAALDEFGSRGRKTIGLPVMPEPLFHLLARCFRPRPGDRPNSFAEIANQLRGIYESQFGEPCDVDEADTELVAADSLNNRAVCALDLNQRSDAARLLKEALRLDPQHPEATFNLGLLHHMGGELVEPWVVKNLQLAADAEPANATPCKLLGLFYLKIGKEGQAAQSFTDAEERALTEFEAAEIRQTRIAASSGRRATFVLAKPRSGSEFHADITRFRRLMRKAEISLADHRVEEATRYLQMAGDIPSFARHPRLRRAFTQLRN